MKHYQLKDTDSSKDKNKDSIDCAGDGRLLLSCGKDSGSLLFDKDNGFFRGVGGTLDANLNVGKFFIFNRFEGFADASMAITVSIKAEDAGDWRRHLVEGNVVIIENVVVELEFIVDV